MDHFTDLTEIDPIDIIEQVAERSGWEFDRVDTDQIAMAIEGQWRTYSITSASSRSDNSLRFIVTFEMEPPEETLPALYELLNGVNDNCWTGSFVFWAQPKLMVYRYSLLLTEGQVITHDQVATIINTACSLCERFYPAFQLGTWGGRTTEEALAIAMDHSYGTA